MITEILVYRPYVHFCFIPVFPIGARQIAVHCRNCGDETRLESLVKKYDQRTKTPFYLYSAVILAASVAIFWFYWNRNMQKNKIEFVSKPAVGDVYTIKKEDNNGTTYSFLKVTGFSGDSVVVFHSNLEYGGFVSSLADDDYFVKDDTVKFAKEEIREMLNRDEIYSVDRGYGEGYWFQPN